MTAHVPVLVEEVVEHLRAQRGGRYVDCTVGAGGHAAAILKKVLPEGRLMGIDADPEAIEVARARLQSFGDAVILVNDSFANLEDICTGLGFRPVQGVLFDLGMSSLQLDDKSRGFSFRHDAPLDMRFGPGQKLTAAGIVNNFSESELASLLERYGEERRSRHIARHIVASRPVNTTSQLVRIVEQVVGRSRGRIHPATKTFQALRIAVNRELEHLEPSLEQAVRLLGPGGRLVVISYHSLEDRIVKRFLQRESKGCLCPPEVPVCVCGHVPILRLITRRVVTPSMSEIDANPRSRSARLRAAERLWN